LNALLGTSLRKINRSCRVLQHETVVNGVEQPPFIRG
jgi:hypothetical protein